jgi:hypothetical protein
LPETKKKSKILTDGIIKKNMQIITLTSVFNLVAAIVCLVATYKMFFVSREKSDNLNIRYYFLSLVFITIYLFVNSVPLLIIKDSFSISVVTSSFYPFLILGGMFLCLIPINLLKLKKIENVYIFSVLIVIITSSVFAFLGLKEIGKISFFREIEYWIRPQNTMIALSTAMVGWFFLFSLLLPILFYFFYAIKKRKNRVVFGKSIMLGLGCLFFLSAVALSYIFGGNPENLLINSALSSLLFMLGAVVFISSVIYKG